MRYRVLVLIVFTLLHSGCSHLVSDRTPKLTAGDPTIRLGMSYQSALAVIRECGGQDITSKLALAGPNGERPMSGLFWSLEQYDAILEIAEEDGGVVQIGYWTVADFSESKIQRFETRKNLKWLTCDKQTRTLKTVPL